MGMKHFTLLLYFVLTSTLAMGQEDPQLETLVQEVIERVEARTA